MEPLETAVGLLLGVCDGASSLDGKGFNGWDSKFARELWSKRPWTRGQAFAVWKMLRKYSGQLSGMGVDYTSLPVPPDPKMGNGQPLDVAGQPQQPQGVTITTREDGIIVVRFPYKPETVELMRQIPDRQWNGVTKEWTIKPTPLAVVA